jgi:hypothetical protein
LAGEKDLKMRAALALILILPVAGCYPAQKQTLAGCIAQSTRTAQFDNPNASQEEKHDVIGEGVAACMKAAGYRRNPTDTQCVDDVDFNPRCYMPATFWAKAVYPFESKS